METQNQTLHPLFNTVKNSTAVKKIKKLTSSLISSGYINQFIILILK